MAETRASATGSGPNMFAPNFAEAGQKQLDAWVEAQKKFLTTIDDMNKAWMARAQSEASLIQDFMGKVTSARSAPEVAAAWQECMSRQLAMLSEDGQRLMNTGLGAMKPGAGFFNGGSGT